jgi:hypothetical protein
MAVLLAVVGCRDVSSGDLAGEEVSIPLISYFRELRTVRASLGSDTVTLLFDTGGDATLITPALAHRIGCRPYGRDVGYRMTGEPVEFQRCDSLTIGLSGWSRRLAPVAVFDVNALLPTELPRVDGVLALDTFREQVLTVDWPGGRVLIHAPGANPAALGAGALSTRTATGESGRMLTVFASVAGQRGLLWFLIDSGNLRGTLIDSQVQQDSLLVPGPDSLVELRVGSRAPFRVAPSPGRFIHDGVLGTDFLQRGAIVLDLRGNPPW